MEKGDFYKSHSYPNLKLSFNKSSNSLSKQPTNFEKTSTTSGSVFDNTQENTTHIDLYQPNTSEKDSEFKTEHFPTFSELTSFSLDDDQDNTVRDNDNQDKDDNIKRIVEDNIRENIDNLFLHSYIEV